VSNIVLNTSAKVIADSVSSEGNRLTTMEVCFPRFILPEFNTHRALCLHKDSNIYFDKEEAVNRGKRSLQRVTIEKLYRMWKDKEQKKLVKAMLLRSLNEETKQIYHTHIKDIFYSGKKDVYQITTRKGSIIKCTGQHKLLTDQGWKCLADLGAYQLPESAEVCLPTKVCLTVTTPYNSYLEAIKNIVYLGKIQVYDIEVEGPYHNFIVDDICCHNSKNSCSSRSLTIHKQLEKIIKNPVVPEFSKNQSGMQPAEKLSPIEQLSAEVTWLEARDNAILSAYSMSLEQNRTKAEEKSWYFVREFLYAKFGEVPTPSINIHKQWVNRLLEPFMWHTVIVSATEWHNFFRLRYDKDAQYEIKVLAECMLRAYLSSNPTLLARDSWHIPYVTPTEKESFPNEDLLKFSAARCARVSYLTHDGKLNHEKDLELHDRLSSSGHWSAFEHTAKCMSDSNFYGNFKGFLQYRKTFSNECFSKETVNLEELLNNVY
jgi:hypothetical protein